VPYPELIEEILVLIREDAEHFGCVVEVEHARAILQRGTSAHRQLQAYQEALASGASEKQALAAVVDMLVRETVGGAQHA
jgi:carboxylate-amine ligase